MSAELLRKIEAARAQVDVAWSDERAHAVGRQMLRRKRRRDVSRAVALVAASLVVLLAIGFGASRLVTGRTPASTVASSDAPAVLELADGSIVTPIDRTSVVRTAEAHATRVVLEVVSGAASFDVTPDPKRLFRVEAGRVAVQVLGTSFTVEKLDAGSAKVSVQRGRVRVSWDQQSEELGAGQEGIFPRVEAPPPASASALAEPSAQQVRAPAAAASPAASAKPSWRALHQEGDFDKAWEALARDGIDKVRDDPADLLAAADVARMSKHSAQAVAPLRRLLASHPGDPRAPLAAFTLGRVLLDELGRPREAADAFAQARRGTMAEDALAREVEAWSRAGDGATARVRAEEYLKLYPGGRREKSVRRYGGLE